MNFSKLPHQEPSDMKGAGNQQSNGEAKQEPGLHRGWAEGFRFGGFRVLGQRVLGLGCSRPLEGI